jgi:hypothetical protein
VPAAQTQVATFNSRTYAFSYWQALYTWADDGQIEATFALTVLPVTRWLSGVGRHCSSLGHCSCVLCHDQLPLSLCAGGLQLVTQSSDVALQLVSDALVRGPAGMGCERCCHTLCMLCAGGSSNSPDVPVVGFQRCPSSRPPVGQGLAVAARLGAHGSARA